MEKKAMKLHIREKEGGGYELFLDGQKLRFIENYKIESSTVKGHADLTLKVLVQYPVSQKNV